MCFTKMFIFFKKVIQAIRSTGFCIHQRTKGKEEVLKFETKKRLSLFEIRFPQPSKNDFFSPTHHEQGNKCVGVETGEVSFAK